MDPEKGTYAVNSAAKDEYDQARVASGEMDVRRGSVVLGEAKEMYGEDAEQYGYVSRGLKSRHIQFIALGGTIGTGLFLGIGKAFVMGGPLSVLLGYSMTGIAIFAMMQCLGEMATWLPLPGAVPQYCARYVDPAMGFAVGWNNWYSSALTLCAEISAAAIVIEFWNDSINQAAWISIILVVIVCLNIFAVSIYGEAEFIFASIKIITIVGLILLALIIDLGGAPGQDRLGFRYWKHPWAAMREYIGTGNTGRFAGWFATLSNAAFAYGGVEMVAVAAGEAENPRKNIPKAVKRVFWRILFFYVLGSLAIGVTVPADDDNLLNGGPGAGSSPWVIAITRAGIPVLPSIINAVILTSATSSGNAFLYTGSRYLFALAQNRQAPRFLLYCTKAGVPIWCVLITASIGLLTYMTVSTGASSVFDWFQTLTTITSLFTWVSILVAFLRFRAACIAQGVRTEDMVFKSRFQPFTAYAALIFFVIIILFNGFAVFTHNTDGSSNWGIQDFVTAYVVIPIYLAFYLFWKIVKRTKFIKAAEADIWTGKAALDAEVWPEQIPRNVWEKIWFWIA
ncbi:amino acid permease [Lecanosticta acicola]|uniref:Amino acid permease n=1 Tax=Lecanosticta acicola TaxID=111012 RepID=A0AAI9EBK1_9PEZI|nr:amino acid permease [Lecanosticta acicola]